MLAISDSQLVALWEQGRSRHPLDRALLTLGAAHPGLAHGTLADWPIGRRNRALAELHCRCFGSALRGWTACARCGEKLEFGLDARALAQSDAGAPGAAMAGAPPPAIAAAGCRFRLPSSRDLASVAGLADLQLCMQQLVGRCLLEGTAPAAWSEQDLEQIGERMAEADPLAETVLALECPACHHGWTDALDLVAFVWAQIEAQSRRILSCVHTLARAYGWSEGEILALSEQRRRTYLEMVLA